jgi:DNA-binding response OmpR family regulator
VVSQKPRAARHERAADRWTLERPSTRTVFGPLEIDLAEGRASLAGLRLHVNPAELGLLALLVANHNRVISRQKLADGLGTLSVHYIDVLLSGLRRQLGPGFVRNVRKRGWILVPAALGVRAAERSAG